MQRNVFQISPLMRMLAALALTAAGGNAQQTIPAWWTNRSVIATSAAPHDYAVANLGQLKWFATNAYLEMESVLPGGAGAAVSNLVAGLGSGHDYTAVNLGQLKATAAPFYERLAAAGFPDTPPWTDSLTDDVNYAVANLGQLKNVFNFAVDNYYDGPDTDGDCLPDAWEMHFFGNLDHTAFEDADGDGLNNRAEFLKHTDPTRADTDRDGLGDGYETRYDAHVVCWGDDSSHGVTNVPPGLTGVVAVAAGSMHCMALKNDGTVVCWGDNTYGQTDVPSGLTGVVAIASGGIYNVALKNDGTVTCWGEFDYGSTNVPPGLTGVVAVAVGPNHSMALKNDGTVVCWGDNTYGQTDVPSGLTGVVAVAAGDDYSMVLKSDGTVACWGCEGESGDSSALNVPAGLSGVVAIASGWLHCMALKNDGNIVCWGNNANGQTNTPAYYVNGHLIYHYGDFVSVAAGGCHSLAIQIDGSNPQNDGKVFVWGGDGVESGGGNSAINVPTGLKGVVAVAGGFQFSIALVASSGLNPLSRDTDGDGLPDKWEVDHGTNPMDKADGNSDPDQDGLTNGQECVLGTSFYSDDTDGDGIGDYEEVKALHTNPLIPDSLGDGDGDGVLDVMEGILGTDPDDGDDPLQGDIALTVLYPPSGSALE